MSPAPSMAPRMGSTPGKAPADRAAPSLTRRLAVSVAVVLAAGSVAVAAAALAYGRAAARQSYDRLILGAANEIAGAVRVRSGEILVDIPASAFELLSLAPDDRVLYAVYGPDGALVTGMADPRPAGGRARASPRSTSPARPPGSPRFPAASRSATSPAPSRSWSARPPAPATPSPPRSPGARSSSSG